MSRFVPRDGMDIVRKVLADVVTPNRGAFLSLGFLATLWTASGGFAATIEALNIAYDAEETRPFWKTRPLATKRGDRFMSINRIRSYAIVLAFFALTTGCSKTDNTDLNYKAAINDHFKAFPACLWSQPKKFPVQAATADDSKTEGYDALTQEGLLIRTTAEKKVLIIASKQVNNYDLSEKGRTSWTPDSSQPGYGNFCYGNREVTSIDNSTPGTNGAGAKTVAVAYHYKIANVAGWANSQEMKTAYPSIGSALGSNPSDTATLVMTGDHWEYVK